MKSKKAKVMDYKKCCIKCGFHFFDEQGCPNCEAERMAKEFQQEWDAQLGLIERFSGISCNDHFFNLWNSDNRETRCWFRSICQCLAPEIYDWYTSIDIEINGLLYEPPKQIDLFDDLPF